MPQDLGASAEDQGSHYFINVRLGHLDTAEVEHNIVLPPKCLLNFFAHRYC